MKGLKDIKSGRFVKNLSDKKCPVCGKMFHPRFTKAIFCNQECKGLAFRKDKSRVCRICGKTFTCESKNTRICSKDCYSKWMKDTHQAEKAHSWKGDDVGYYGIHVWLKKTFGRACKCENPECSFPRKNSKGVLLPKANNFQWAKIKGKPYKRKRDNFMMLCPSCHQKYDRNLIELYGN